MIWEWKVTYRRKRGHGMSARAYRVSTFVKAATEEDAKREVLALYGESEVISFVGVERIRGTTV
jgi:limonene-1,2-epoxide hydrolase